MTAPKFTHRDRMLLAGMIEPHVSRVSYGGRDSLPREDIAARPFGAPTTCWSRSP